MLEKSGYLAHFSSPARETVTLFLSRNSFEEFPELYGPQ